MTPKESWFLSPRRGDRGASQAHGHLPPAPWLPALVSCPRTRGLFFSGRGHGTRGWRVRHSPWCPSGRLQSQAPSRWTDWSGWLPQHGPGGTARSTRLLPSDRRGHSWFPTSALGLNGAPGSPGRPLADTEAGTYISFCVCVSVCPSGSVSLQNHRPRPLCSQLPAAALPARLPAAGQPCRPGHLPEPDAAAQAPDPHPHPRAALSPGSGCFLSLSCLEGSYLDSARSGAPSLSRAPPAKDPRRSGGRGGHRELGGGAGFSSRAASLPTEGI